jgi:gliding motility-associated-like protein
MRNCLIPLIILAFAAPAGAQLVNGGFETCSAFPSNTGQWQVVQGWNNAGSMVASPDYFHYNAPAAADIPETPLAWVDASEGQAIMGLIACGRKFTQLREYVTAVFSEPLEVGRIYRVAFRITNGRRTPVSTAGLGVKGLGLYFSTSQPVQSSQTPLLVTPHWTIDEVLYSEEWESFSCTFEAVQPFMYMTFGLFGTDDDKEIVVADGHEPLYAYYFLDDVSLTPMPSDNKPNINPDVRAPRPSSGGVYIPEPFYVPNSFTPNNDGFNDEFRPVAGSVSEWEFSVFNGWGERVFHTLDSSAGWDGSFNSRKAEAGSYVWEIRYREFSDTAGWTEREERGVVTLVR